MNKSTASLHQPHVKSVFHSIYSHGFMRATVCIPALRVAEPSYNADQTLTLARRASDLKALWRSFPS